MIVYNVSKDLNSPKFEDGSSIGNLTEVRRLQRVCTIPEVNFSIGPKGFKESMLKMNFVCLITFEYMFDHKILSFRAKSRTRRILIGCLGLIL